MFLGAVVALLSASATTPTAKGPKWLSDAVFYQIYPSSFQDSDGNGIGDLPGIISRLDYIQSLGVNALWLNPVYESGWFDGGYDIIDFYRIDPRFGTNSDMVRLIDEAHKRGATPTASLWAPSRLSSTVFPALSHRHHTSMGDDKPPFLARMSSPIFFS